MRRKSVSTVNNETLNKKLKNTEGLESSEKLSADKSTQETPAKEHKGKSSTKDKRDKIAKSMGFVTDKGVNKRTRILKNLVTALFFGFAIGVLVYTAINDFAGKPIDWNIILNTLKKNWIYLILAVLAGILFITTKGVQRSVLCKSNTGKWHFKTSLEAGLVCQVYNNVTPLAVGGQPFEISHFTKHKLNGGEATSVVISAYIVNMFTSVFLGILAIVCFRFNLLGHKTLSYIPSTIFILAIIGLCANLIMPALVIMFCISPRLCSRLVYFVIWLGEKLKIVKNPTALRYKTLRSVLINSRGVKRLFKRPLVLISTAFLSALEIFFMSSIAYFTLRFYGFGGSGGWHNGGFILWIQIMEITILLHNAVAIIPTPGNAGAADLSFYAIFEKELAAGLAFPAMFTWRLLNFYLIIVFGFIAIRLIARRDKKLALLNH